MWVKAGANLSNGRLVLPPSGGQRELGRDKPPAEGSQGQKDLHSEGRQLVDRLGETPSSLWTPRSPGSPRKEARVGIVPNNIYSYSLLSTYHLPRTIQCSLHIDFWSS